LDCLSGTPDAKPALQAIVSRTGEDGVSSGTWQPPPLTVSVRDGARPSEWCHAVAQASRKREIVLRRRATPSP